MINLKKVRWMSKDGSVFTESEYKVKLEFAFVNVHHGVMFNVGREIADHIVRLHNESLEKSNGNV